MRYRERIRTLKKELQRNRLDGLFITKEENISYLSGFDAKGSGSGLIITSGSDDFLVTDERFKEDVIKKQAGFRLKLTNGSRYKAIASIVKSAKIRKLGFESDSLNFSTCSQLKHKLKKTPIIPTRNLIEGLRLIKDRNEIALIKKAILITKKAYLAGKDYIRPSLSGEKVAVFMDNHMRKSGAERPAFPTIVVQNPYSSRPHGPRNNLPFKKEMAIVIDMGACFKGYNSDLTRAVFLGKITSKFKYIYNILKTAQDKALKKVRPGARISQLDRAARQYIGKKGLGKYFIHSLGHGVGLEIHESPHIYARSKVRLKPGMVFTIEPGIYIEGWGGLRVEDIVLVTEKGFEVLTRDIPK